MSTIQIHNYQVIHRYHRGLKLQVKFRLQREQQFPFLVLSVRSISHSAERFYNDNKINTKSRWSRWSRWMRVATDSVDSTPCKRFSGVGPNDGSGYLFETFVTFVAIKVINRGGGEGRRASSRLARQ